METVVMKMTIRPVQVTVTVIITITLTVVSLITISIDSFAARTVTMQLQA